MAKLFCSLGDVTNLAVARDTTCLFSRVSFFGIEGIAQRLSERRGLTLEHSRQWLTYVGLDAPLETIEGDPEIVAAARRRSRRVPRSSPTSCGSRSTTTAPRRRARDRGDRRLRARHASPGSPGACSAISAAGRVGRPAPLAGSTTPRPPA